MEVASYIVEETEPMIATRFCEKLTESGYEDFHVNAVAGTCRILKESLGVDLMSKKSFAKACMQSVRPHLFINAREYSVVMLSEPTEKGCIKGKAFEVTCFSKSLDGVHELLENTKKLLTQQMGFPSTIIHDGSFDENCNKAFIKSLSETQRTDLMKKVGEDILSVFTNMETKTTLRRFVSFPMKTFVKEMLDGLNPDILVSSGIMKERFAPNCKKCVTFETPYLFDSVKEVSAVLENKALMCANCGNRLESENAIIRSFYQFTDLGLECAKGLWLEAYVKNILEKLGISGDRIKLCSLHGRDEIDVVFSEGDTLFVCECRDKAVGQNDIYVLATKVSRIKEDEDAAAYADKVLIVSTEPIPKDILITPQGEGPQYLTATGNAEEIKGTLVKAVNKARLEYKNKRLRELSDILLWFLPSKIEEAYLARLVEEEYIF